MWISGATDEAEDFYVFKYVRGLQWWPQKRNNNKSVNLHGLNSECIYQLIIRSSNIFLTMNWTPVGLNWTVLLKCLEITFVVIWCYINKTEFNWISVILFIWSTASGPAVWKTMGKKWCFRILLLMFYIFIICGWWVNRLKCLGSYGLNAPRCHTVTVYCKKIWQAKPTSF